MRKYKNYEFLLADGTVFYLPCETAKPFIKRLVETANTGQGGIIEIPDGTGRTFHTRTFVCSQPIGLWWWMDTTWRTIKIRFSKLMIKIGRIRESPEDRAEWEEKIRQIKKDLSDKLGWK